MRSVAALLAALLFWAGCQSCGFRGPDDLGIDLSISGSADLSGAERPRPATHLTFVEPPRSSRVDFPIGPVVVAALDEDEQVVTDFAGTVKVYVTGNAADVTLQGAVLATAQAGLARFEDLSVDRAAQALSLAANSRALGAAASPTFDVSAAAWSPANTDLDAGEVLRILVDPVDPTQLIVATPAAGVFMSTNSGLSFSTANLDLGDRRVRDLAISGSGTLYAATAGGLYQRLRGNPSWNLLDFGESWRGQPVTAVAVHIATLYAAVGGRILSSSDTGSTWSALPAHPDTAAALRLAVAPDDDQLVFASDGATIVKSTDGGSHFARAITGLGGAAVRDLAFDATGALHAATSAGAFRLLPNDTQWSPDGSGPATAVSVSGSDVYIAGDNGLERWNGSALTLLAAAPHPEPSALAVSPTFVHLGTRGGAAFRWDGAWSFGGRSLSAARVTGLRAVAAGTLVCATGGGLFRSTDQASTWTAVTPGADPRFDFVAVGGSDVFALSRGTAWRSSDGGALFTAAPGFDGCSSLVFDPADPTVAWCPPFDAAVAGVYRIVMDGTSRMLLQNGLATHVSEVAAADSQSVFAVAAPGLFHSADAGAAWSNILQGNVLTVAAAGGKLLVSTAGGALYSDDGGANFQPLDSALTGTRRFFTDGNGGLYAAAEHLWRSTDGGATWTRADSGLGRTPVTWLAFDPGTPLLVYAGSDGAGLFRATAGGQ